MCWIKKLLLNLAQYISLDCSQLSLRWASLRFRVKNEQQWQIIFSVSGDALTFEEIKYPCVVKASLGEDTRAVRLVKNQETLHEAIEHALSYSDNVIIERYKFAFGNRLVCSSIESAWHNLLTCQVPSLGTFWIAISQNVGWFYRFIEGREIRCAVLESVKTGKLKALACIEYDVCQDDIRKTEVKYQFNGEGLPIGKYTSFACNFNL